MSKPIVMTDDMIESAFKDVRDAFEKAYKDALEKAKSGKKLASGKFRFDFKGIDWSWQGDKTKARLTIEDPAYFKMMAMVRGTDKEIAWHGVIERDPDDETHFIVKDVFLFPQKVTGTTVETDDDKYAEWVASLPDETFFKMRYHGHSHVNMGVTPSGVDMDYRSDMLGQFTDGFYVFMIINKKESVSAQIYDFDNNTLYEDSEIDVELGGETAKWIGGLTKEVDDGVKEYVTTTTYTYAKSTSSSASKSKSSSKSSKSADTYQSSFDDYYDGVYGGSYGSYFSHGYYSQILKKMVYPGDPEYDPDHFSSGVGGV